MKLFFALIGYVVLFLITIGNGVLWFLELLLRLIRITLDFTIKLLREYKCIFQAIMNLLLLPTEILRKITINVFGKITFPLYYKRRHAYQRLAVSKKEKRKQQQLIRKFPLAVKIKYFLSGFLFAVFFIALPLAFLFFLQQLPDPHDLTRRQISQTTKIFDRNGALLYQIYANQNRTIIPLAKIPLSLQEATISIEDKDFYQHPGFDITAIIRSFISDVKGQNLQGGSTITQQLIKSALLTPETKISRKIKEVVLAFWAERIYSKNDILQMYLNQVPYGGTAWGVEAASETYFGKSVTDLDLAQCAFLAGMPQAPTIYSPYNSATWKNRQKEVLNRMRLLGYISYGQEKSAEKEELDFLPPRLPIHAPHFVMYVKDYLVNKYGLSAVEKGGLSVTTTLDLKLQENTQKIVTDEIANDTALNIGNGAALITDPKNGDILAMVGSHDYYDPESGNVNATTSLRQPGSSIKVVLYSDALSHGYTAATPLNDTPVSYPAGGGVYAPVNYDGRFHGIIPLRVAFANSFNIPPVKILNQLGVASFVNLGKKMGATHWGNSSQYGLSVTLGAADVTMTDMATIYGVMANEGKRVDLNPILKVTDYKGELLEDKSQTLGDTFGTRVLDPGIPYIISDILADNNARSLEFGPNSPLNIRGHHVSVKTGTTDEVRDNWTIGYTTNRLVAVWVGNDDNTPMNQNLVSGITGAAPIWNKIMSSILQTTPEEAMPMPSDIVTKPCYGHTEYFLRGTENSVACNFSLTPTVTRKP